MRRCIVVRLLLFPRSPRIRLGLKRLSGVECLPNDLGDLLGEAAGSVEVFTKEAHLALNLAVDNRAAFASAQLHAGFNGCRPSYRRNLALSLAALLESH